MAKWLRLWSLIDEITVLNPFAAVLSSGKDLKHYSILLRRLQAIGPLIAYLKADCFHRGQEKHHFKWNIHNRCA